MNEKEKLIQKYMKNLSLTRAEAEEMWQDEQDDNLPDLTPEQAKVVKEMTQADRKKETKPRARKPDEKRRTLMTDLAEFLTDIGSVNVEVTNIEREVCFTLDNVNYRLTLAKPRK